MKTTGKPFDGKPYSVLITEREGAEWAESGAFASEESAEQHADFLVNAGKAVSAKVMLFVSYHARQPR